MKWNKLPNVPQNDPEEDYGCFQLSEKCLVLTERGGIHLARRQKWEDDWDDGQEMWQMDGRDAYKLTDVVGWLSVNKLLKGEDTQ